MSGGHCLDAFGKPGNLARCGVAVQNTATGSTLDFRFGNAQGANGVGLVSRGDRFFNFSQIGAYTRAARLVDRGAGDDLRTAFLAEDVFAMVSLSGFV